MTPADLLSAATSAGLALRVEAGALRVRGPQGAIATWAPMLKAHKPALIALLQPPPERELPTAPPLSADELEDVRESVEERAGILEFDAGIPRSEAESLAAGATRVFQVLIGMGADEPPRWITMLCPGCTLAEASRICAVKFGVGRVLKVLDHGNPLTTPEPGRTLH